MARLRTTVNRITERIETDRRRSTRTVCKYGIPLVLLASVLIPVCIPFWAIIWFAIFQSVRKSGSAVMLAGAAGEDHALTHLSSLPDEYTVFNQICLPDSRSITGFREADFVVLGPTGVFLVENKSYRGWVEGDWNSDHWEIHRIGRCGTPYTKSCRNPVRQVQVYVSLLAAIFSSRDIKAWITPMVSLSRDNSLGLINSEKVQVVRVADLCENILAHHGTLSKENMDKVLGLLEELRAVRFNHADETEKVVAPCWASPVSEPYERN
jgi:hypothetical protein